MKAVVDRQIAHSINRDRDRATDSAGAGGLLQEHVGGRIFVDCVVAFVGNVQVVVDIERHTGGHLQPIPLRRQFFETEFPLSDTSSSSYAPAPASISAYVESWGDFEYDATRIWGVTAVAIDPALPSRAIQVSLRIEDKRRIGIHPTGALATLLTERVEE